MMKELIIILRKNWVKILITILSIFIVIFLINFQSNKMNFYASQGIKYAKKGNYQKAQEYYEKSFELGNTDTAFRIAYVNTLVNSPLTIDAQEKLVKFAEGKIQDSASESALFFLKNLKKEIHNKYPKNYVKQAPFNNKIVHWGKMPITYSFKQNKDVPKELISAINDAFDTWERASSVRIRFDQINSDNADIVIKFDNTKISNAEYGRKYVIASTVPYINNNKLIKMVMNFSILNLDGKQFTPNQIYNTALHEILHALGFMGHSFDKNNVMYITKDSEELFDDVRKKPSDADKSTLELFYKIKPDITNAKELKYDYIPYLILGDEKEINENKIYEAKNYIRKAPTIASGYIDLAQSFLNQQKYTASIAYLEKALRLAGNDNERHMIYFNLAVANYYDGNYELAHFYIQKAEYIKTDNDLLLLKAEIFSKEDKLNDSIKIYKLLLNQNPNNIDYVIPLTNAYIKEKKFFQARKTLKTYLKNNPKEKNNKKIKSYGILLRF